LISAKQGINAVNTLLPRCFSVITQNVFLSPTTAKAGFDSRPGQDSLVVSSKSRQALLPGMELTTHPPINPSL
jgi:hypothetical protein